MKQRRKGEHSFHSQKKTFVRPLPNLLSPREIQYLSKITQAAKFFAMFAKSAPIGGQLGLGLQPCRRIDVFEVFALLATLCRGSIQQKAMLLFDVFDVDRSHDLSEDELALLIFSVNSGLSKLRLVDVANEDEIDYAVTRGE